MDCQIHLLRMIVCRIGVVIHEWAADIAERKRAALCANLDLSPIDGSVGLPRSVAEEDWGFVAIRTHLG